MRQADFSCCWGISRLFAAWLAKFKPSGHTWSDGH